MLRLRSAQISGLEPSDMRHYLNTEAVIWLPILGNANDMSGHGNHATVAGASLTTDNLGYSNRAYLHDGVDDYLTAPNSPSLSVGTQHNVGATGVFAPFTVAWWMSTLGLNRGVFMYGSTDVGANYGAETNLIGTRLNAKYNNFTRVATNAFIVTSWAHYAITFAPTYTEFWFNGQLNERQVGQANQIRTNHGLQLVVGGIATAGAPTLSHSRAMSDFRVYPTALPPAYILALAQHKGRV